MTEEKTTTKKRLWSFFKRATGKYRLADEAEGMAGEVLTGHIILPFLRIVFDVVLIWGLMFIIHYDLNWFTSSPACVNSCFVSADTPCCPFTLYFVLRAVLFLTAAFLGSYLGTRFCRENKLRHSSAVMVFFLVSALVCLIRANIPGWIVFLSGISIFVVMFQGYKLTFRD